MKLIALMCLLGLASANAEQYTHPAECVDVDSGVDAAEEAEEQAEINEMYEYFEDQGIDLNFPEIDSSYDGTEGRRLAAVRTYKKITTTTSTTTTKKSTTPAYVAYV